MTRSAHFVLSDPFPQSSVELKSIIRAWLILFYCPTVTINLIKLMHQKYIKSRQTLWQCVCSRRSEASNRRMQSAARICGPGVTMKVTITKLCRSTSGFRPTRGSELQIQVHGKNKFATKQWTTWIPSQCMSVCRIYGLPSSVCPCLTPICLEEHSVHWTHSAGLTFNLVFRRSFFSCRCHFTNRLFLQWQKTFPSREVQKPNFTELARPFVCVNQPLLSPKI